MPNAAIVAAALTDGAVHAYGLFVETLDVLKEPGGTGFGVEINSIEVDEQGPGGVSALSFVIDDPDREITISEGQVVRFHKFGSNNQYDLPIFLGFIQSWTVLQFGLGRQVSVRCVGIEALLDWMIVPNWTLASSGFTTGSPQAVIQQLVQAAYTAGYPLNAVPHPTSLDGDDTAGIGTLGSASPAASFTLAFDGETLRNALTTLITAWYGGTGAASRIAPMITVDFYGNLRIWRDNDTPAKPDDYDTLTVVNAIGSSTISENLQHETDAGSVVHRVYVRSELPSNSVTVSDGVTSPAPVPVIDDPINNPAIGSATTAGEAYLFAHRESVRGSFDRLDHVPSPTFYPQAGAPVDITDTQLGVAGVWRIGQIGKSFTGERENWHFTYGGLEPRASTLIRMINPAIGV